MYVRASNYDPTAVHRSILSTFWHVVFSLFNGVLRITCVAITITVLSHANRHGKLQIIPGEPSCTPVSVLHINVAVLGNVILIFLGKYFILIINIVM